MVIFSGSSQNSCYRGVTEEDLDELERKLSATKKEMELKLKAHQPKGSKAISEKKKAGRRELERERDR